MRKHHIREFLESELHHGRAAGMGMLYDRYDEESGPGDGGGYTRTLLTSSHNKEDELPGPVITYKMEDV